jgi:hypothetical protein
LELFVKKLDSCELRWQEPLRFPNTPHATTTKDVILTLIFMIAIFAFVLAVALPSVLHS